MSRKTKPDLEDTEQKAGPAEAAATGPETPATGNGGEAEAGVAQAAPAEADAAVPEPQATSAVGGHPDEFQVTVPSDARHVVLVKGPAKGRWRAGRLFGPEPVELDVATLTPAEQHAIANDPELTVIIGG